MFRGPTYGLLLAIALCAGSASAQSPTDAGNADTAQAQAARTASDAWYTRAAAELAATGKPRALAFAATLLEVANWQPPMEPGADDGQPSQPVPVDARIDRWRVQASTRAGKDVIANALLMTGDKNATLRTQAAARWRAVEPDNLAPTLLSNMDADALLAQARTATRFDLHYYDKLRWMQQALVSHPPTSAEFAALTGDDKPTLPEMAIITVMGIDAATAMPGLAPVSQACRKEAIDATPRRGEDCRHLAQVLANASDTLLGSSVGRAMLARLARSPAQAEAASESSRQHAWRQQQWIELTRKQPRDGMAYFLRLLADPAVQSEPQLIERLLQENNIPLQPPADWQPQPYRPPARE